MVDDDLARIASSLTHLKVLDIPCTLVTDSGLQHLFMFECLKKLNVSECRDVSDAGLHHLPVHLEKLYMFNCNITDRGVLLLSKNLRDLHSVDVASTRVTDQGKWFLKLRKRFHISTNFFNQGFIAVQLQAVQLHLGSENGKGR